MSKRPFIGVSTSVLVTMIIASIPGAREEGLARQASRQAKGKGPNRRLDAVLMPCSVAPAPAPEDAEADTLAACVDDTLESDTYGLAYHLDRLHNEGRSWGEVYAMLAGRGKPYTYRQIAECRGLSANGCQVAASNWRTANKVTA